MQENQPVISVDDGKKYPLLKIENMVYVGKLAESLDIDVIAGKLDNCVFNRKKFPGAVYHMKEPKITVLLFSSGKVVMTGITVMEEFQKGLEVLISQVNGLGFRTSPVPDVSVKNSCYRLPLLSYSITPVFPARK